MSIKKFVIAIILISMMLVVLIGLTGCVSKTDYDTLLARHGQLESDNNQLESDHGQLESEHNELVKQYDDLTEQHDTKVADYDTLSGAHDELKNSLAAVEQELAGIKKVYPLRDFTSVTELYDWIDKHEQPEGAYLEGDFRAGLKVQEAGLADGYLISVMYDEDDTDPEYGWIFCGALVNGQLYMWYPSEDSSYAWYVDTLMR